MAATNVPRPSSLVDPSKGAKFPIQLGESFTKASDKDRYVSVKYNHKPKHTTPNQTTTITSSNHKFKLVIADDSSTSPSGVKYKYEGTLDPHSTEQDSPQYSYGLVFSPEKSAFALERFSSDLHFNLVSNPGKATKTQLQSQYPQLEVQPDPETADEEDELLQDGVHYKSDSDSGADDANPYDYRHYLPHGKFAPSTEQVNLSRSQSPRGSPYLGAQNSSTTNNGYLSASPALKPKPRVSQAPLSRPVPRSSGLTMSKAKPTAPVAKPKAASPPRIVKDSAYSSSSSGKSDSDSGSFRRSKKAKTKRSSDLIIDLGSPPPQPKRTPLQGLKNARKGGAPISFHEATSASENEGDADESGLDVDMDVDTRKGEEEREEDADYEMDDEDVEVLKLPSPARAQSPPKQPTEPVGLGLGTDLEEEDDLAAALMMELNNQAPQQEEESEVSEEE